MAEIKAYDQAAGTGRYEKASGLSGKYDNIRRLWEDQLTGIFLRPVLNDFVGYKRQRLERLRVLDVGCGSGDGFELLMGVTARDPGMYEYVHQAITPDILQEYVGIDINDNLLSQAAECYNNHPKMRFLKYDISQGLPFAEEEPFDIYLTSYGTMSHFKDELAARIIADICEHAPDRALFIGDWLGRYSYEWQDLWHHPADEEYFMDYRISYIYPPEERQTADIPVFPLRLITRKEIEAIIGRATSLSGVTIKPITYFDRSVLVGRHLATNDYNPNCTDLRKPINSLFESYTRTDLEKLLVDYVPRAGFVDMNEFFESFFMSTNMLVQHTIALLAESISGGAPMPIQSHYPEPLQEAIKTMELIVETCTKLRYGDPRANIIEPHLGYSLRKLEMELQPGTGVGHGLVGVFEIRK
jgi:SAM-dependent methyltransferase